MKFTLKTLIVGSMLVSTALVSCKKSDSTTENPAPQPAPEEKAPTSFTKKVLIEEYTGAWCGWCVDGAVRMNALIEANAGKVIGVAVHDNDGMTVPAYTTYLKPTFKISSFPGGAVDRIPYNDGTTTSVSMSRTYWSAVVQNDLAKTADCGLKIDAKSVTDNKVKVTVSTAFKATKSTSDNLYLTVYVIEDGVTGSGSGYDQHNYYSSELSANYPTHPFYNQPQLIFGYVHNHVLRQVLTDNKGNSFTADALKAGKISNFTFTADLTGFDKSKCSVVAFINKVGATYDTHEVLNVQETAVGSAKTWN